MTSQMQCPEGFTKVVTLRIVPFVGAGKVDDFVAPEQLDTPLKRSEVNDVAIHIQSPHRGQLCSRQEGRERWSIRDVTVALPSQVADANTFQTFP